MPEQQPIDLSGGLVPKSTPASSPNPDGGVVDLSGGLVEKPTAQATTQPEEDAKNQPGGLSRFYETSGLKGIIDSAKQKADEDAAVKDQVLGHVKEGNYGAAAESLLKHLTDRAGQGLREAMPGGPAVAGAVKGAYQHGKQAVQSAREGKTGEAIENAAEAVPVVGQLGEQVVKPLATDVGSGNISGAAGDVAGGLAQLAVGKGIGKLAGAAGEEAVPKSTSSAVDLTSKAKPTIKETGQDVQASAEKVRNDAGKAVGKAKAAVKDSLPEGQLEFPKDGQASTTAKQVLSDIGSTKLGLKDPDMAEIKDLAQTLADGKTAEGKPLTYSPEEADAERRSLNSKIDALKGKADQGGNATALRHLTRLKQGFDADYFDMLEKHGDPAAAQNLKTLNKQYADIVANQTDSPAAKLLNKQSPEQIVTSIISGGKNSQTAVEELVKNLDDAGKKSLADSVLKEMHSKATLTGGPNQGNVNMQGVQTVLEKMGDTAKAVFGKDLPAIKQYTDAAADYQAKLEAKAAKPSVTSKIVKGGARMAGAGGGAMIAGPLGAVAGEVTAGEIADSLFQQGRSGAVKIGISPTEKIVLSPAEAAAKRPMITKFLKAKSAGNTAAMASAYNALAGKKNEDKGDEPKEHL